MNHIIFEINGGIGKSIMATAVIRAIKMKYPNDRIIVISEYPVVFLNNPNVYRVYRGNTSNFYEDYVKNHNVRFMCLEPYKSCSFLNETKHLTESWCDIHDLAYCGDKPELFLTPLENQRTINQIVSNIDKPIAVIQPFGGFNKDIRYSWNRDIPPAQAQKIVNELSSKYAVFQIGRPDQIQLNNAIQFSSENFRDIFSLINLSSARIGIDSFMHHCAAAFSLTSTVCWITNNPKVFGYDIHRNILPIVERNDAVKNPDGLYGPYDFTGSRIYDFPYTSTELFDVNDILSYYL